MKPAPSFALFAILSLLSIARAQGRAPHGLIYESPLELSPQAYDFFHPNAHDSHAPLPLAATVQSDVAQASVPNRDHKTSLEAGGIAAIVLGAAFAVISAIGVFYVVTKRRNNLHRTKSVQSPPVQAV